MPYEGKTADYRGFGEDVKRGLSKAELLKKYGITSNTAYRTYLYRARLLGILGKGELPGKPVRKGKPKRVKQPSKPDKPLEPFKPFEPSQPSEPNRLKVHWELPRELVARIRYKATIEGRAVIDLVREALNKHF